MAANKYNQKSQYKVKRALPEIKVGKLKSGSSGKKLPAENRQLLSVSLKQDVKDQKFRLKKAQIRTDSQREVR